MANSKELSQLAGVVTVGGGVVTVDGKLSITAGTDANHALTKSQIEALIQTKDELSELSGSTDDVAEGSVNLYYTDARVHAALSASDGITYSNGAFSLTDTGVTAGTYGSASLVPVLVINENGQITSASTVSVAGVSNFTFTSGTHTFTIDTADGGSYSATGDLVAFDTGDLAEGSNLYYTDARARASVSVTDNGGDGSLSYNSSTGEISYTGPSDSEVWAHFSAGTGVDITSGVVSIGQPVATTDSVTFADITIGSANLVYNDGYLEYNAEGGTVPIKIGATQLVKVYNDTGATLYKGQVVRSAGSQGNVVSVQLAKADAESTSAGTLGMVAQSIAAGAEGYVIVGGIINSMDTSTLSGGAIYLSAATAGAYTQTKPEAPNHLVVLGYVERISASVGSIYIKVDNGYELNELHDVYYTTPNNNDLLKWNASNSRWELGTLTTSEVAEGTNLYYTSARANTDFDTRLATKTTTNLAEGSNLYYTDVRVQTKLGSVSGHIIPDTNIAYDLGSATNRFRDLYLSSNSIYLDGITLSSDAGTFSVTDGSNNPVAVSLDANTTSDLAEGSNLYYTDARVQSKIDSYVTGGTGVSVSGGQISIGQAVATTSDVTFNSVTTAGDLTIGGDLTVNGTTTTVNATNLAITDNMIYLNEGSTVTNPDLGWAGNYNDGTYAHTGIFRDASDSGKFKFYKGYTPEPGQEIDTAHASFTLGEVVASTFYGALSGNASTASSAAKWTTARTITLGGDLTGNVSIDGSANVTLTATVAANSVALGTDTTGNYVAGNTAGSYILVSGTAGEGWSPTIAVDATSANTASKVVARDASGNFSAGTITAALSGNATTATTLQTARTISLTGDVTGSVSFNGSADAAITATIAANSVALGTDTTGNYMVNVAAGGGITVSHTQGEGSTATVSHADTSSVANLSSDNANGVVIQDVALTFDTYGHVQTATVATVDLDGRYSQLGHTHSYLAGNSHVVRDLNALIQSTVLDGELHYHAYSQGSTGGVGMTDNANGVITVGQHNGGYNAQLSFSSDGHLYWRESIAGGTPTAWQKIWKDGSDGSGSGLDADLLDGIDSASFLRSDADDSFSGNLTSASAGWVKFYHSNETDSNDGKIGSGVFGTGLNIVGTQTSAGTGRQVRVWGSLITDSGNAYWHSGNDGSGSGLDADTLDGVHASSFQRYFQQSTNPGAVADGSEWWDTANGILYKRIESAWVQLSPAAGIGIYDVNGTKVN